MRLIPYYAWLNRGPTDLNYLRAVFIEKYVGREDSLLAIYDASDLFSEVADPVYIDYVHMSGRGNRIIAEKLVEILKPHLCGELPPRVSEHLSNQLGEICQ